MSDKVNVVRGMVYWGKADSVSEGMELVTKFIVDNNISRDDLINISQDTLHDYFYIYYWG